MLFIGRPRSELLELLVSRFEKLHILDQCTRPRRRFHPRFPTKKCRSAPFFVAFGDCGFLKRAALAGFGKGRAVRLPGK